MTAGATGSEERQEYAIIGDTVNVAARIEDLNKTYPEHDILLSEFTQRALGARVEQYRFADLGDIPIRGRSQPIRVWGLLA